MALVVCSSSIWTTLYEGLITGSFFSPILPSIDRGNQIIMFGLFGGGSSSSSSTGTAASNRLKRAQQLRQQRYPAAHSNKSRTTTPTPKSGTAIGTTGEIVSNKKTDEEEEGVLVVSGLCTLFCAFLIVCLGAAMATLFFMLHQPDCTKGMTWSLSDASISYAAPDIQQKAAAAPLSALRRMKEIGAVAPEKTLDQEHSQPENADNREVVQAAGAALQASVAVDTPAAAAAAALRGNSAVVVEDAPVEFPPQCTAAQFSRLAEQLPAGGCNRFKDKAWRRTACSFSMATSCNDFVWFKKYHAKNPPPYHVPFTSIHVGCNKGYQAVELLAVGSQDPSRYDWKQWKQVFVDGSPGEIEDRWETCPHAEIPSGTGISSGQVRAYCIEPVPKNFERLSQTKAKMGWDDELRLEQLVISHNTGEIGVHNGDKIGVEGIGMANWAKSCAGEDPEDCTKVPVDQLDHWITTSAAGIGPEDPIHYMSLGLQGYDFLALIGSGHTLKRIQYLELQYHWFGNWESQSLKDMVIRMKRKNFVCYWAGDNKLWRLTDCYQEHYENRFYANIACVNAQLAPGLAKEMEDLFQKTLELQLTFGEK